MPELAYLNGWFCPLDQAKVSIEDRGFQFADGIYEVIVFYGSKPVMLEAHLQRLAASARGIRLDLDFESLGLKPRIEEGVRIAGLNRTVVYVQLTRGTAPRNHVYPKECRPTVAMTFKEKPEISEKKRAKGYSVVTIPDFRWSRCHLKTIALLPNVLAKNEALDRGYDDAVFIGPEDDVREASSANIFIIRSGRLITRPEDETILPGITRRLVLRCAERIKLPVNESVITRSDLLQADEVFLCSTTLDIMPVTRVDDHPVAGAAPGQATNLLSAQLSREFSET